MAGIVSPPAYSKHQLLGLGYSWTDNLPPAESMTSIMSYQYPPLPPSGSGTEMPRPAYIPTYNTTPQHPSSIGAFSSLDNRPAHPSHSEMHQHQSQLGLSAERKRNKLGYHRTSVACGYCRRRKIRCVPEPSDGQARCTNCIRMKKDCIFHPVDQPPTPDTRANQAPYSSTGNEVPPASLSPAASSGSVAELSGKQSFSPISQKISSASPSTMKFEGFPPEANAPSTWSMNRSFEFRGQTNWMSADASQSPGSRPGDLNATWQGYVPASPISAQLSPFGPGPPSATWTSGGSEPGSRGDVSWGNYPPPARSMSYGGEPHSSNQPMQYPPGPQGRQFDRRASTLSDVYTPSMGMAVIGMDTSAAPGMDPPGQAIAPAPFGAWNQPQQSQHPSYSYVAWGYGENGEPGQQLANNEPLQGPFPDTR